MFLSDGKEVFLSFIILFKFSKFIFYPCISVCSVLFGCVPFGCGVFLFSEVGGSFSSDCSCLSILWKKKWVECYLRLAGSVSGDILADMNVYQPLIFMVRVESRRSESDERSNTTLLYIQVQSPLRRHSNSRYRRDQTRPDHYFSTPEIGIVLLPDLAGRVA